MLKKVIVFVLVVCLSFSMALCGRRALRSACDCDCSACTGEDYERYDDPGDSDCATVLDQLYQAYAESHESDPSEISEGFKELEEFLCNLPLEDNNAVFNLCCRLCCAYERKAFIDGLQ